MVLFFFALVCARAGAQSPCRAQKDVELVECVLRGSPERDSFENEWRVENELVRQTDEWERPEVELEALRKDAESSELTAGISFVVPLGGKRSAQRRESESSVQLARQRLQNLDQEIRLATWLRLTRLSHLEVEIQVHEESISTFRRMLRPYQKRAALSPEQRISQNLYEMALAETEIDLARLNSQRNEELGRVSVSTQMSAEAIRRILPPARRNWPDLRSESPPKSSVDLSLAAMEKELALRSLEAVRAQQGSDLKVGPVLRQNQEGEIRDQYLGFSLSFALPVTSAGGAAQKAAIQKLQGAEQRWQRTRDRVSSDRSRRIERYHSLVQVLTSTLSEGVLRAKHELLERQLERGFVPAALVVESHRQWFDLLSKRNEAEREAIEILGTERVQAGQLEGELK